MATKIQNPRSGQTIIMFTLALIPLFGILGLVVDVGWAYFRKEAAQTAAQAGALAAATHASRITTSYPTTGTTNTTGTGVWIGSTATQCATNPTNPPTNNFQTACLYAKANGFNPGTSRQNVLVAAGNGSTATVPGVAPSYYITVTVTETIPLTFLAALGSGYFGIASANATGGIVGTPDGACLYLLDPSGKDSLNASNNAQVTASCGVYIDSNNSEAAIAAGGATVRTTPAGSQPPIKSVGATTSNNGGSFSPGVTTTPAGVSDPLSNLDIPWTNCTGGSCPATNCQYTGCTGSASHCDHTNFVLSSGSFSSPYTHLSPGIYCGTGGSAALTITNGNSAIFDSGMYVINGGGVSIQSGGGNSGSSVVFYLTGTNANFGGLNLANGTTVSFAAPTTGDLADVLVYADRSLTAPTGANATTQFQGGATSKLDGIIYLPNSTANFANGTTTANRTSLVVKDAIFAGGAYVFTSDPAGTLKGTGGASPFLIGSR